MNIIASTFNQTPPATATQAKKVSPDKPRSRFMLTARSDHLKSIANSHRAILSPARRVPPEILSEIFSWSPGAPTQDPWVELPDSFDPRHGPLLFTQVCRFWRQTAFTTPKLWSTIRVVLGPRSKVNLIELWLERSKNSGLTIAILDRASSDDDAVAVRDLPFNPEAIRRLASQSHRWKSVFLHLPPYISFGAYWDVLVGEKRNIGRLRQLTVHITRGELQSTMPVVFMDGPRLTSLTVNHLISGDALPTDGSGIAYFCYGSPADPRSSAVPIPECIKAMRKFPNLVVCTLYCEVHSVTNITDVTMPKLERLHVKLRCGEDFPAISDLGTLWRALNLPSLKTLVVGSSDIRVQFHREELPGLLSRCPMLTTLVLAFAAAQPQDALIEILQKAHNLRNLTLMSDGNLSQVFTYTSQRTTASQPSILPRLQMIRVTLSVYVERPLLVKLFATWIPMVLGMMDASLMASEKDLLRTAVLEVRQQEPAGPGQPLCYLRSCLDTFGPANWEGMVFIGTRSYQIGQETMIAFSIGRRQRRPT